MKTSILSIIEKYRKDPFRLMDILLDIQEELGYIPEEFNQMIADELSLSRADLEETISFYHFFSQKPLGKWAVKKATAISPARIKATGRVNSPATIAIPPKNSSIAAIHSKLKKSAWLPPNQPSSFDAPRSQNKNPAKIRRSVKVTG